MVRDGKGLWEVPGSSPNGDKNLPIKKKTQIFKPRFFWLGLVGLFIA